MGKVKKCVTYQPVYITNVMAHIIVLPHPITYILKHGANDNYHVLILFLCVLIYNEYANIGAMIDSDKIKKIIIKEKGVFLKL